MQGSGCNSECRGLAVVVKLFLFSLPFTVAFILKRILWFFFFRLLHFYFGPSVSSVPHCWLMECDLLKFLNLTAFSLFFLPHKFTLNVDGWKTLSLCVRQISYLRILNINSYINKTINLFSDIPKLFSLLFQSVLLIFLLVLFSTWFTFHEPTVA